MGDVPTAVKISFLVTGLLMIGWLIWGIREYNRTGKATWLWMSVLLGVSLVMAFLNYQRFKG